MTDEDKMLAQLDAVAENRRLPVLQRLAASQAAGRIREQQARRAEIREIVREELKVQADERE